MESSLFERIKKGLEDVIAFERGDTSRCRVIRCTDPVPAYTAQDVVRIRESLDMDRVAFALLIGVSSRTVQAWETGRSKLTGPVRRLLYLLEGNPALAERLGFGDGFDYTKWQREHFDSIPLDSLLEAAYAYDSARPIGKRSLRGSSLWM